MEPFSPIVFRIAVKGTTEMNYRIEIGVIIKCKDLLGEILVNGI